MSDKKKDVNGRLNELFGVPDNIQNVPEVIKDDTAKAVAKMKNAEDEVKLEQDFELSRSTLHKLITQGESAIFEYMQLVTESESPRAYEVLAKLLDTVASLSKDNVELHNMKKMIKDKMDDSPGDKGSMNIKNANILVGTTSDLQKMVKDKSNEDQ